MRTHIVLPSTLVKEIDTIVGQRQRSAFIQSTIENELIRLRQKEAFAAAKGTWKNNPGFRTKKQVEQFIRRMRDSADQRAKRYAAE